MSRLLMLTAVALASAQAHAAKVHETDYTLVTSAGPIGTLAVRESGSTIDNDWKVDDNGRGPKLKEHVELDRAGLPRVWSIEGHSEAGAPVKESFTVEDGRAKWVSLDDHGEGEGKDALYLANYGTPWANELYLRALLRAKDHTHATLPGGSLRLERLRDLTLGEGRSQEKVTAYAIWGLDIVPAFVLARHDRLVATLYPGWILVEQAHAAEFPMLNALAAELSGEALAQLTRRVRHPIDGPLWITNVRVFDSTTGTVGAPTNVGVFRDAVVYVGPDAPPADALRVDGSGGTLLPGLLDSHAHLGDWDGAMHIAAGVTFARDPGNDNALLLARERRIAAGEFVGPRMKNSGFLEGKSPDSAHLGFIIDNVEDAKAKVRWYAAHGYWGIKIYNSMNPDFVKPIAEEAHRLGLHVSGHVPAFMSSERAIRDGYDEINHINQLMLSFVIDPLKDDTRTPFRFTALGERMADFDPQSKPFQAMIALMLERHTTLDSTMATFAPLLLSRPGKASPAEEAWLSHMPVPIQRSRRTAALDIKPQDYAIYDASYRKLEEILKLLHKSGVPLVPGTDDEPGVMLHSELEIWVQAGIPAADVLQAATLGGARFLGLEEQLGTVARGKLADLYLVDGDPTQDITAIRRGRLVLSQGAYYYPDEIHEALGMQPFTEHAAVQAPKN